MLARRRASPLLVLGVLLFAGCAGEAAVFGPSVSPPPSSSPPSDEELAFRAAEETYRAYVDALNEVDLADPSTFEPVFALATSDAQTAARDSLEQMHANGWSVSGSSKVSSVMLEDADSSGDEVILAVCLDVSEVDVRDAAGASMTGDRPAIQGLTTTVTRSEGMWLITKFEGRPSEAAC